MEYPLQNGWDSIGLSQNNTVDELIELMLLNYRSSSNQTVSSQWVGFVFWLH